MALPVGPLSTDYLHKYLAEIEAFAAANEPFEKEIVSISNNSQSHCDGGTTNKPACSGSHLWHSGITAVCWSTAPGSGRSRRPCCWRSGRWSCCGCGSSSSRSDWSSGVTGASVRNCYSHACWESILVANSLLRAHGNSGIGIRAPKWHGSWRVVSACLCSRESLLIAPIFANLRSWIAIHHVHSGWSRDNSCSTRAIRASSSAALAFNEVGSSWTRLCHRISIDLVTIPSFYWLKCGERMGVCKH